MTQIPAKPPQQIIIDLPEDLQPIFANLARIAHAPAEFVFDFARFLPGDTKARVTSRVVMTPGGVKMFAKALAENISRFEAIFGEIIVHGGGSHLADTLFRPFQSPPGDPPKDPPASS